jgi:hypothetical protein
VSPPKFRHVVAGEGVANIFLRDSAGGLVRISAGDKPVKVPAELLETDRARAFLADGRLVEVEVPKKKGKE